MNTPNNPMKRTLRLLPFLALPFAAQAQIPNGGFETWVDNEGVSDPANWGTLNPLGALLGVEFASQGVGAVGNYCMELTTRDVAGIGILPSIAFVGDAQGEVVGFPLTSQPAALTGQYKFAPQGEDMASIVVNLWRWDEVAGEQVELGAGYFEITAAAANWTTFNVAIDYIGTEMPDSANITLLSSTGETTLAGTKLSVDALAFTNSTSVTNSSELQTSIFPNPAMDRVTVTTGGSTIRSIEVWSTEGRLVSTHPANADRAVVDVQALRTGAYALRVVTADGTVRHGRFVKY